MKKIIFILLILISANFLHTDICKAQKSGKGKSVEMLSFTTTMDNKKVNIMWSTASETNNDYFIVERSEDMDNWQFVCKVNGAGNSTTTQNYSIIDYGAVSGTFYYRLIQTDFNGKTELCLPPFSVISENTSVKPEVSYFPNPFTSDLNVDIKNVSVENATLDIYDILGDKILEKNIDIEQPGNNKITLNLSSLPVGVYFVKFTSENYTWTTRLVKNH